MTEMRRSEELAAERVSAGAELLDKHYPNWQNEINVDTLDMYSLDDCILGQLYGDYGEGKDALGLVAFTGESTNYGFNCPGHCGTSYRELADAWIGLIEHRRNG